MEEKALFDFRASITEASITKWNPSSRPSSKTYILYNSLKKLVNGKVTETTTPSFTVTGLEDWIDTSTQVIVNGIQQFTISVKENTGSARIALITLTQEGSGYKIPIQINQETGITYTGVIEIPQFYLISLENKAGASTTFTFTAYLLGSDGSKRMEKPSVKSLSSWLTVTSVDFSSSANLHEYVVTFTANSSHSSNLSRIGEAVITCGTTTKNINISQLPSGGTLIKQFTLKGLPLNKSCYLFADGSRPQSGSGGTSGYLMIHGLDGSVTMNIPVTVNLSSYGDTTKADTGDRVTVWTSSGTLFSQIGSFTVPSAGGTVSI